MSTVRTLLNLTDGFIVQPTGQTGVALNTQKQPPPTWLENLLPTSSNQLQAIRELLTDVDPLPSSLLASASAEYPLQTATVGNSAGVQSVVVYTNTELWVLQNRAWVQLCSKTGTDPIYVTMIKGTTYYYARDWGVFKYLEGSYDLTAIQPATFTYIDPTQLNGLCAACGYLIAYDNIKVYWSSPLNSDNFEPDQLGNNAGAGFSQILAVRGSLVHVVAAPLGFYVFTTSNIIYAQYTQNPNNPWKFTEVANSPAITSPADVASWENSGLVYGIAQAGVFLLSGEQVQYKFPEISSFFRGTNIPIWDTSSLKVQTSYAPHKAYRITFVNHRYFVLSYGASYPYDYALVFDTQLSTWARLNYQHVTVLSPSILTRNVVLFKDWEVNFEDETRTFYELLQSEAVQLTAGFVAVSESGELRVLSADAVTSYQSGWEIGAQLPNVVFFGDLALSANRDACLTEVTLYGYSQELPTTEVPETPTVLVAPLHDVNPIATRYQPLSTTLSNQTTFVERVRSGRLKIALLNCGSLDNVEVALVATTARRGYKYTQ